MLLLDRAINVLKTLILIWDEDKDKDIRNGLQESIDHLIHIRETLPWDK